MTKETSAPLGKLPPDLLQMKILRYAGFERPEVKIGPKIGEDAAVIDWPPGQFLVVSSDPIVGASQGAGRLLVFVNSNDIFSKGGEPAYLVVTLILPASDGHEKASRLMAEIDQACRETGIAIVGGHTEFTDRYELPVVVGTIFGTAPRVLSSNDILPGDVILMTKHAGLEGMTILAQDRPELLASCLEGEKIEEIRNWTKSLSIGPEARCLAGVARFMHDPTEGGLMGGLSEIASLTPWGLQVDPSAIPIHPYTLRAAQALGFDPLRLISSGVLLAILPGGELESVKKDLSDHGVPFAIIGRVVEGKGNCSMSFSEELWGLLAR
jgi:hydrogenase expression/formation protein HypE